MSYACIASTDSVAQGIVEAYAGRKSLHIYRVLRILMGFKQNSDLYWTLMEQFLKKLMGMFTLPIQFPY